MWEIINSGLTRLYCEQCGKSSKEICASEVSPSKILLVEFSSNCIDSLVFHNEINILGFQYHLKGLVRCHQHHFTCTLSCSTDWIFIDDLCDSIRHFRHSTEIYQEYNNEWFFAAYALQETASSPLMPNFAIPVASAQESISKASLPSYQSQIKEDNHIKIKETHHDNVKVKQYRREHYASHKDQVKERSKEVYEKRKTERRQHFKEQNMKRKMEEKSSQSILIVTSNQKKETESTTKCSDSQNVKTANTWIAVIQSNLIPFISQISLVTWICQHLPINRNKS